jgi:toxin secretion/phage lysis holin
MAPVTEIGMYVISLLRKIIAYPIEKALFSLLLIVGGYLFDEAMFPLLGGLLVLIIFDFITGVAAAKTSGEEITSSKISRSAFKVVFYSILISGAHLAGNSVQVITLFDDLTLSFLSVTELISIIENVGRMGFCTPKRLLNTLKDYTTK